MNNDTRNIEMVNRRRRAGFTLIEMIVSMIAASVLLAGIASSIYITSQGTLTGIEQLHRLADGADAHFELAADLEDAVSIQSRSATSIEFRVPDRDGDLASDTIRYEWTGTAGVTPAPLTRTFNGGPSISLVDDVYDFQLEYGTRAVTTSFDETVVTAVPESMFDSFEGWSGVSPTYQDMTVGPAAWAAEYFALDLLPPTTSRVAITRVQLILRENGGGGVTVSIHHAKGGGDIEPGAIIGTPVSVSLLPSTYQWVEVTFPDVSIDNLTNEFVLLVKGSASASADLSYLYAATAPADTRTFLWTTDSGAKWDPKTNSRSRNDMFYRVWGSYETTDTTTTSVTHYFLNYVGARIQFAAEAASACESACTLLNEPEVAGP